ncbi:MAG: Na/Pi cotransporter family protein [Velocimicrobium sp.]
MSMDDVKMLFQFIGGLGMFLYGMNAMADGLQKTAGNRMKNLLKALTSNRLLAISVGALITAIIQSSSATTVMVVGFVNAGLFDLTQAVGVIMGANIGTTITAWLVSMNEWGEILKPEFYAPVIIGIGAFILLFSKDHKKKQVGEILVGFSLLFIGLSFMSGSIKPYRDAPIFVNAFKLFGENPILGILTGAVITAIIQSSSASVGILQTLAMNGVVSWSAAVFITLGQNIGTCVTALLSSVGAHRTAKRAAIIHLLFNLIGAVLFGIISFVVFTIVPQWAGRTINSVEISIFHTVFNITNTLVLLPFANGLVTLSGIIVKKGEEATYQESELEELKNRLDERIFESPSFAVERCVQEVVNMGLFTLDSLKKSKTAVLDGSEHAVADVFKGEVIINGFEKQLTEYMVKIDNLSLNDSQHTLIKNLLYTVSDIERVGDHCENLVELAQSYIENDNTFSKEAREDLENMFQKSIDSYESAINARLTGKKEFIEREMECEETVDRLEKIYRRRHVERLGKSMCTAQTGVLFTDVLSNLERVSDHAENIAQYVQEENEM